MNNKIKLSLAVLLVVLIGGSISYIMNSDKTLGASVLQATQGGTGTGVKPTIGQVLLGQSNGTYAPVATSSLGITGGGGSQTPWLQAINGGGYDLTNVATTSATKFCLTGDSCITTWPAGATSSVTYAYASSTFVTFTYASSTFPSFIYGSSTYLNANSIVNVAKLSTSTSGYVLQSLGNTAQWVATSTLGITGGSGSPAGTTSQLQYNNAGSFGASANLTYSAGGFTAQYGSGSGGKLTVSTVGLSLWDQSNGNTLTVYNAATPGISLTSSSTGTANGNYATLDTTLMSANRLFQFPNKAGTFAMTSDVVTLATSTIQTMFSNTATGLTYTSGTGVTSLTSGYSIPTTDQSWTNNGVYISPASTTVGISVQKLQVLKADSKGFYSVRIGTGATPSSTQLMLLDYANGPAAYPQIVSNWGGSGVWGIGPKSTSSTDNTIKLSTASNYTTTWDASSNIIFEPSNFSAPGLFYDSVHASGTKGQVLWSTGTSTLWVATSTLGIAGGNSTTTNNYNSQWTTSGNNIYFSSSTGNVAIGTTSSISKLTVNGDVSFSTSTQGPVMTSPNGTYYRLQVTNNGYLTTTGSSTSQITLGGVQQELNANMVNIMISSYINNMSVWEKFKLFINSIF